MNNQSTKVLSILFILFSLCILKPAVTFAQTDFTNADGSPFHTTYCYADSTFEIIGTPIGGTFSGLGVTSKNGKWYFNPITATIGTTVFPVQLMVTYTPVGNTAASKVILIQKPVEVTIIADSVTCTGAISLFSSILYAGSYASVWIPSAGLATPDTSSTTGVIDSNQTFVITATDDIGGCTGSDSVTIYFRKPLADITFMKDTLCAGDTLHISATNFNNVTAFAWQLGRSRMTDSSYSQVVTTDGSYPVTLIANNDACTDTIVKNATVVAFKLNLTTSNNIIDSGDAVTLKAFGNYPFTVDRWLPANLFTRQDTISQIITLDTSTYITVFATSIYGCKDSTHKLIIVNPTTSVNSLSALDKDISTYPNPANDHINIKAPIAVNVSIATVSGQTVLQQKDATKIYVGDLADGTYIIRIADKDGAILAIRKMVKAAR